LQAKEQVLVSEIAKLRRQSAQEQYGKQTNGEETDETPAQENIAAAFIGENNTIYNKERAIIQFILRNGEKPLLVPEDPASGTPSFTESVISNMNYSIAGDGIEFSHPLYKKIFEEAAKEAEKPDFIAEKHFLAHPDAEISRLTAELCNDRYMLSKFFQEKADEEERNETAILFEHATRLAISYKLSLVDEMLKETMKKLKEPATMQSAELAQEIMQNYKFLKETQQALNNQLRDYGFGECALNV
jgi:DNA primase